MPLNSKHSIDVANSIETEKGNIHFVINGLREENEELRNVLRVNRNLPCYTESAGSDTSSDEYVPSNLEDSRSYEEVYSNMTNTWLSLADIRVKRSLQEPCKIFFAFV